MAESYSRGLVKNKCPSASNLEWIRLLSYTRPWVWICKLHEHVCACMCVECGTYKTKCIWSDKGSAKVEGLRLCIALTFQISGNRRWFISRKSEIRDVWKKYRFLCYIIKIRRKIYTRVTSPHKWGTDQGLDAQESRDKPAFLRQESLLWWKEEACLLLAHV